MPHCTVVCFCIEKVFRYFQQVDIFVVHLGQDSFEVVVDWSRDGTTVDTEDGHLPIVLAQLFQYLRVRSHKLVLEGLRLYGEIVGTQVDDNDVRLVCFEVPQFLGAFIEGL